MKQIVNKKKRVSRRKKHHVADNSYAGPSSNELAILSVIRKIPRGRVLSYGEVARRAGLPGRARLVGRVLRTCPLADAVPWHRVIRSDGRIAARDGPGTAEQRRRLEAEDVLISPSGRV